MCCFFFFKQKTAYEMRISDWSSDVCSSDLRIDLHEHPVQGHPRRQLACQVVLQVVEQLMAATRRAPQRGAGFLGRLHQVVGTALVLAEPQRQRPVANQPLDDLPALARVERVPLGTSLWLEACPLYICN